MLTTHELNAVAAHLPWVVCVNGGVIAEGPPDRTCSRRRSSRRTYGAEMTVVRHEGMTLVAETPHHIGRSARAQESKASVEH